MATPNLGLTTSPNGATDISGAYNPSMLLLDAIVQLSIQAILNAPPATVDGDKGKVWIIGAAPTGAWAGKAGQLALCTAANVWAYFQPQDGWRGGASGSVDYRYDEATNTWVVQSPLPNPMTTPGDIIVGGASGSPTRLAVGANGKVLGVVAGAPAYVDPPASSESIIIACSDETTALTTGTGKVTFRMPYALTVSAVKASLTTAQTSGGILTIDINEGGVSILSTKLTIDNTEKTSVTAAIAAVISDAALAADAEITIDIDQIGDGTAKGLKVSLIGNKP
jgi:hypothetical protein